MAKLKGSKKATSVGFGGQEYPVKKGIVEVPDAAVAALTGGKHGWVIADEDPGKEESGTENGEEGVADEDSEKADK